MKPSPAQPREFVSVIRWGALFFLAVALASGCGARKRPSIPWATAVQVKPVVQGPAAGRQTSPELAPDLIPDLPPLAAMLLPVRGGPARPHVAAQASSNNAGHAEKVASPEIAPQLSLQESVVARQETSQSLSLAEKNLAGASGKSLNAMQVDLISKINGFLKDAREAAHSGDWSGARSLAKKAEVLSEELAKSF